MSLFALGTIDPLLVDHDGFSGFDLPAFVERVRLLSDGLSTDATEILQSTGIPSRTATIKGTLEQADCDILRGYDETKEVVEFLDGNGNSTLVRVLELTTEDYTHWWAFVALLYMVEPTVAPGS